ncbi:MAG: hypothetical protein AB1486_17960 [Planctomycetota bacterium]
MTAAVLSFLFAPLMLIDGASASETPLPAGVPFGWTLEEARRSWKSMTRAAQHVGVPGFQFQAGVLWDGGVVLGPLEWKDLGVLQQELFRLHDPQLHLSVAFADPPWFADRQGFGDPRVRRQLLGGRLPIPQVETRDGELVWQETVFAHLLGCDPDEEAPPRPDDRLVTHMLLRVRNEGYARRTAHLWLHFGDTSSVHFGYKCGVAAAIPPALPHRFEPPYGRTEDGVCYVMPSPRQGLVRAHERASVPAGASGSYERPLEWEVEVRPGESAELRLVIPYGPVSAEIAAQLAVLDTAALLERVAACWRGPARAQSDS